MAFCHTYNINKELSILVFTLFSSLAFIGAHLQTLLWKWAAQCRVVSSLFQKNKCHCSSVLINTSFKFISGFQYLAPHTYQMLKGILFWCRLPSHVIPDARSWAGSWHPSFHFIKSSSFSNHTWEHLFSISTIKFPFLLLIFNSNIILALKRWQC